MIDDGIKLSGEFTMRLYDECRNLIDSRTVKNVVTTVGKEHVAKLMAGEATSAMAYMAVGSGATSAVVGDVALVGELARVALTSKATQAAPNAHKVDYVGTFLAGTGTGSLQEAGIFDAATSGVMQCRQTYAVLTKGANDILEITWTVTVG